MTVEEVKKIIDEESLKGGNLFEKRENKVNCPLCQGHFELV